MSIVLYGATGYTGQLVTDELVRRGATFTLAGRNPDKLAALATERGQGAPWRAVAADDRAGLRDLLADAAVVINCAGPFTLAGDALPAAAAHTGTHYLDSTGEQTFMQQVFERHGAEPGAPVRRSCRRWASTTGRATAWRASSAATTSRCRTS